jgi:hypothetical protein
VTGRLCQEEEKTQPLIINIIISQVPASVGIKIADFFHSATMCQSSSDVFFFPTMWVICPRPTMAIFNLQGMSLLSSVPTAKSL